LQKRSYVQNVRATKNDGTSKNERTVIVAEGTKFRSASLKDMK